MLGCLLVLGSAACSGPSSPDDEATTPASPTSSAVVNSTPESTAQMVMCVGESPEHPSGSTVRVDVQDRGAVTETTYIMVPMQLVIPLPSGDAQVLVDGVPWMAGPAADDPLHAYGSGCPTSTPPAP